MHDLSDDIFKTQDNVAQVDRVFYVDALHYFQFCRLHSANCFYVKLILSIFNVHVVNVEGAGGWCYAVREFL